MRRRSLLSVVSSRWYPYSYEYLYHNLIPNEVPSFNLWDEEIRNGYYDTTGAFVSNSSYIANKNPIRVLPNTDYYWLGPSGKLGRYCWYDNNMNFISTGTKTNPSIITSPANARFLNIDMSSAYGTTYNHDICINKSNSQLNGIYAPYNPHLVGKKAKLLEIEGNGEIVNQLATQKSYTNTGVDGRTAVNLMVQALTLPNSYALLSTISSKGQFDMIWSATFSSVSGFILKHNGSQLDFSFFINTDKNIVQGHKYLISMYFSGVDPTIVGGVSSDNQIFTDLTQRYGTGHEPTSVTDPRIRRIIENGYIEKNDGTYRSSVVDSLVTRGFNLFDGQLEQGSIDGSNGQNVSATTRCRSQYIRVMGGRTCCLKMFNKTNDRQVFVVVGYDINKNYVMQLSSVNIENGILLNDSISYVRFVVRKTTNVNVLPTDFDDSQILLNEGEAQSLYKPFKSFNIWNEIIIGGYYDSANGVYSNTLPDRCCSQDFIGVNSALTYAMSIYENVYRIRIFEFDENKNYLTYQSFLNTRSITMTLNSETKYIKWDIYKEGSNWTANPPSASVLQCCINISNPNKNGLYLPFGILDIIKLPAPIQLDGALDSHSTFEVTNTEYVFTRNNWKYKFSGSEEWVATTNNRWYTTTFRTTAKKDYTGTQICNIQTNTKYHATTTSSISTDDLGIIFNFNGDLMIRDTTMTQASDVQTYWTNKTIVYQLATPQITRIPRGRLGVVDLGSLDWNYQSGETYPRFLTTGINTIAKPTANNSEIGNIWCSKYISTYLLNITSNGANNVIAINNAGNISVRDTTYTDPATFKQAMSGVYLFYETATEVQYFINQAQTEAGGTINATTQTLANVNVGMK